MVVSCYFASSDNHFHLRTQYQLRIIIIYILPDFLLSNYEINCIQKYKNKKIVFSIHNIVYCNPYTVYINCIIIAGYN